MKLRDIPKIVLADSSTPLSSREIWSEAVRRGLDKEAESKGKTPDATIAAYLYTNSKGSHSLFVAVGAKPTRFRLAEKQPDQTLPPFPLSAANTPSQTETGDNSPLSFLKSAEKVLRESGAKQPMHYHDITERAISRGWLVSDGATPEATMAAQIGTDIKKRADAGKKSIFIKCGRGYFGLTEWVDPIQTDIDRHNSKVRADLLAMLREMPPDEFENLIGRLLDAMDFLDTEVTKKSGDGGIDVRGTWTVAEGIAIKMAIQVKRWKKGHNVQAPVVQAVRGALKGSERGMIITTSDFSKGAREDAENLATASTISLVNGEQLVKLLVQYGIGVKQKSVEILELDGDFAKTV